MTFEEKIDRCNNVAGLTKIVCEISASFGKPSPDHSWIEAAIEVAANQEADYACLLLRAGGRSQKDRHYFVVFDDRSEIARIAGDLQPEDTNGLFGMSHADYGYEGITYNAAQQRFYLLVEARKQTRGCYKASIVEYDDDFRVIGTHDASVASHSPRRKLTLCGCRTTQASRAKCK